MARTGFIEELLVGIEAVTDEEIGKVEAEFDDIKSTDRQLGIASDGLKKLLVFLRKMELRNEDSLGPGLINLGIMAMFLLEATIQKEFENFNPNLILCGEFGIEIALIDSGFTHTDFRKGWVVVVENAIEPADSLPNLTETLVDPDDGQIDNFENEGGKSPPADSKQLIVPPTPPLANPDEDDEDEDPDDGPPPTLQTGPHDPEYGC